MTVKIKKMRLVPVKGKVPQPHFDEITKAVAIRNDGKTQAHHIDESYLISEVLIKHFQPAE